MDNVHHPALLQWFGADVQLCSWFRAGWLWTSHSIETLYYLFVLCFWMNVYNANVKFVRIPVILYSYLFITCFLSLCRSWDFDWKRANPFLISWHNGRLCCWLHDAAPVCLFFKGLEISSGGYVHTWPDLPPPLVVGCTHYHEFWCIMYFVRFNKDPLWSSLTTKQSPNSFSWPLVRCLRLSVVSVLCNETGWSQSLLAGCSRRVEWRRLKP